MNSKDHTIAIVGAGLVGSLLSIYLTKRGYRISVFERRADMRKQALEAGRSINLALSSRGIRALEEIGLADVIKQTAVPMHGRIMHDREGKLTFQPYGKQGQFINSVSRSGLNKALMTEAEKSGVEFFFDHRVEKVNLVNTILTTVDSRQLTKSLTLSLVLMVPSLQSEVHYSLLTDLITHRIISIMIIRSCIFRLVMLVRFN